MSDGNLEQFTETVRRGLSAAGLTVEELIERLAPPAPPECGDVAPLEYEDMDGNPITLDKLCRTEPKWAANRIRAMTQAAPARVRIMDYLHERAEGLTKEAQGNYRGDPSDLACKGPSMQADILREVIEELRDGKAVQS